MRAFQRRSPCGNNGRNEQKIKKDDSSIIDESSINNNLILIKSL